MKKPRTVAILTNFAEFNPGYSLTGIVVEQAYMLLRNGHKVLIYVSEQFNDKLNDEAGITDLFYQFPDLIKILKKSKFMHLTDYQKDNMTLEHTEQSECAGKMYFDSFEKEGVTAVFTHDFIFTGWNLPFYHAIKDTSNMMRQRRIQSVWYHWVHSIPSGGRDWWTLDPFGLNHHVVFPNKTEIMRVAEAFNIPASRVSIIPHLKDIRNWYDFSVETRQLLDNYPNIMQAEVIQVYPCSTDRLMAKQLDLVIKMFANFKMHGKIPVFLVIANQWATGRQRKEDVRKYIELAEKAGLVYSKDFIFTSEWRKEYATGIPKKIIRELQLLSNLFVFPTREESFGLVGPEAAYSGALVVTNRSLSMMQEVMSSHAPAFDFGSFHADIAVVKDENYIKAVSMAILNRLYSNEALMTKVYCRQRYNMESIYSRYYVTKLAS